MFLGLILLGFIIAVAFAAFHKSYETRDLIGNIIIAIIAAIQGKVFASLLLLDNIPISQPIVLALWILGILYLKKLFFRRDEIRYIG